jgi:hypothetical protein
MFVRGDNAEMDNSHIQHYLSSLHGSLNAGEAVLLDKEFLITDDLRFFQQRQSM